MMLHSPELSAVISTTKKSTASATNKARAETLLKQMLSQFEGSSSSSKVVTKEVREK